MGFLKSSDEILGVGEFSARFKALVKAQVPELWLRGEVSNLKTYSSGHTYFTLKDADGAVSAVLFRGYAQGVSLRLSEGMKVLAYGEISIYEARGTYQIIVKAMMPDGLGDLARRFEELKEKLSREGLFDASAKKPIPRLPGRIAVVTSPTGAAIRDFLSILRRRGWRGEIAVMPSRVQGAEAAGEIAAQIRAAQGGGFDLLVVMRGGGSLEDLWPFNEEAVARAVAASEIPVISAVGHEIDFTLSDFAADLRAETPSAAAEYISSGFIEAREGVRSVFSAISEAVKNALEAARGKLEAAAALFAMASPASRVANLSMALDDAEGRLDSEFLAAVSARRHELSGLYAEFSRLHPGHRLEILRNSLDSAERQLELLGVDATLRRGFAMALSGDGGVIKSAKAASEEAAFRLIFHDGEISVHSNL